jgi:hypothetical protein
MSKGPDAEDPSVQSAQRVYHCPELKEYGDLRDITKLLGSTGSPDNPLVVSVTLLTDITRTSGLVLG